jgi:hypothetical protein
MGGSSYLARRLPYTQTVIYNWNSVPHLFNTERLTSSAYDQREVDIHYIEDLDTTVFNRHGQSHSPEAESIMIVVLYAMTIENATVEVTTFPSSARDNRRYLCPAAFYGHQVG